MISFVTTKFTRPPRASIASLNSRRIFATPPPSDESSEKSTITARNSRFMHSSTRRWILAFSWNPSFPSIRNAATPGMPASILSNFVFTIVSLSGGPAAIREP